MIAYLPLIAALMWATVSDIKTRTIPDMVHVLLVVSGLILIFGYRQPWKSRVAAFLLVGAITLILGLCVSGIGGGDIKMMAAAAFALGLIPGLYSLMIALILALLYMLIAFRGRKGASIPFAPFLSAGCVAVLIAQNFFDNFLEMI